MERDYDKAKKYVAANIKENANGCHEWVGPVTPQGYGQVGPDWVFRQFGIKGAHRLTYHLATGFEFTDRSQQVMHSCNNRRCCNVDHLSVGTPKENMQYAKKCGRAYLFGRGEKHPQARITENQAKMIKVLRRMGYTIQDCADLVGTTFRTVAAISCNRSWKHVTI